MSQEISAEGNTKNFRFRSWIFTYNNPDLTWSQLSHLLDVSPILKLVGQKEVGESGTPHFQGVVQYRNQVTFKTLRSLCASIHWEGCKSLKASLEYVTKIESRIDGPWCMGWDPPEPLRINKPRESHPWQGRLEQELAGRPDDRTIIWIWDYNGGVGKSSFCKYMAVEHGALVLGGRAGDIKYGVATHVRKHGKLGIGLFHFTRSNENFVSYEAIEAIKDGMFFSGKYESGMILYNSPHIVCFANFPPDFSKLSEDRWSVREIKGLDF